ncbi:DUF1345 domain-containing protein [Microbacterium lushaniae]|uniref:DUF1345 domain-containing protein n=1 Tax=Microbacterium lushaniae TaxID=2614639 RepID=A0A5J6L2C5_9MICO|nr:DUF1345 domain-containing protein [Microbacterium lushaniae]QEW02531.1 DUF1345 domain-containing protein [Microbacterium lushaniae]
MGARRTHRVVPRAYDDTFRSLLSTAAALCLTTGGVTALALTGAAALPDLLGTGAHLLSVLCVFWTLFAVIYLSWTHVRYTRCPPGELRRIADVQHHRRPSGAELMLGFGSTGTGTVSAALIALIGALGSAVIGIGPQDGGRVLIVLLTVASSWATMVYAFALRYLRLDAAGERISFDIDEAPEFEDFLSMSVMVSSIGALSAGTPRTGAALRAVRTHTLFAFVFNAFIVAMTVSLVVGLVTA